LIFGRWWKITLPVTVVGWPALLILTGVDSGFEFAVAAGLLAAANVVVGVFACQTIRLMARRAAAFRKARRLRQQLLSQRWLPRPPVNAY
jgi:hypothetical protein